MPALRNARPASTNPTPTTAVPSTRSPIQCDCYSSQDTMPSHTAAYHVCEGDIHMHGQHCPEYAVTVASSSFSHASSSSSCCTATPCVLLILSFFSTCAFRNPVRMSVFNLAISAARRSSPRSLRGIPGQHGSQHDRQPALTHVSLCGPSTCFHMIPCGGPGTASTVGGIPAIVDPRPTS